MKTTAFLLAMILCGAVTVTGMRGAKKLALAPELPENEWLNTPGNKPLSMKKLRGKVVLVEFWTFL